MKVRPHNREAFTLLEIMIVVAVIGFLSLLAIPNITRARQKTRVSFCRNNQRIIRQGVMQFAFNEGAETIAKMPLEEILQQTLDLGYIKERDLDCPSEALDDHNDYKLEETGEEGELPQVWVECLIKPDEHNMESF